jgi:hypothetical protein
MPVVAGLWCASLAVLSIGAVKFFEQTVYLYYVFTAIAEGLAGAFPMCLSVVPLLLMFLRPHQGDVRHGANGIDAR